MKFSDLFVPRYMHSNPEVRIKAVGRLRDIKLLGQIADKDEDRSVRDAAAQRINVLRQEVKVAA